MDPDQRWVMDSITGCGMHGRHRAVAHTKPLI
jgi:hypothetical protein